MEQKAGGKHGGIGLDQLFKARGRNSPFPVSLRTSHQPSSQKEASSRMQALGKKPTEPLDLLPAQLTS